MSKAAEQKKFQRGLLGIIFGYGFLGFLVTCFCVTRVEPSLIHHVGREHGDRVFFDVVALRGDSYVVSTHNLAAGTVLKDKDIKVVFMPSLRGYEKAFGDAELVLGRKTSHAVPAGQPVLPYHVNAKSNQDGLSLDMERWF